MDESLVSSFTGGSKAVHLIASGGAEAPQIELYFDQSGLNRSSRDQPETRYYCPEPGCKSSFKRKYDIDRHYQAKHVQSKNFFCPVKGCKCSVEPDLAAGGPWASYSWDSIRRPLKCKEIARDEGSGYCRYLLHGFHRKDRLLKHVAKYHKELAPELASLLEERDACLEDPLVAETQDFSKKAEPFWSRHAELARILRKDGSWTDWSGRWRNNVAALGFKPYVSPGASNIGSASKVNHETYQLSPGYGGPSPQGSGSSCQLNLIAETMEPSHTQDIQPMAARLGYSTFPTVTDEMLANARDQGISLPTQRLEQTALFPPYEQVSTWNLNGSISLPMASSSYGNATSLPDFGPSSNELMAPMQTSQPYGSAIGSSTNMFDFNSLSFEGISGDIYMPVDGGYAPAETGQTTSEDSNASSGEYFDSVANYGFDAAPWNPTNGTQGW